MMIILFLFIFSILISYINGISTWIDQSNQANANGANVFAGRYGAVVANLNNKILIWGGRGQPGEINHFERLLYLTDQFNWEAISVDGNTPDNRIYSSIGGPLKQSDTSDLAFVIFGGQLSATSLIADDSSSLNILKFDQQQNKLAWSVATVSGDIPVNRFGHSATAVNSSTMFMFGGNHYDIQSGHFGYLDDFFALRNLPGKGFVWTKPSTAAVNGFRPSARSGHSLDYVESKSFLILFGGKQYNNAADNAYQGNVEFLNDVWTLETEEGSLEDSDQFVWSLQSTVNAPLGRAGFATFVANDTLYVYGGYTIDRQNEAARVFFDELYTLDLNTWTWTLVTVSGAKPVGRHGHNLASFGSNLVSIGGVTVVSEQNIPRSLVQSQVCEFAP